MSQTLQCFFLGFNEIHIFCRKTASKVCSKLISSMFFKFERTSVYAGIRIVQFSVFQTLQEGWIRSFQSRYRGVSCHALVVGGQLSVILANITSPCYLTEMLIISNCHSLKINITVWAFHLRPGFPQCCLFSHHAQLRVQMALSAQDGVWSTNAQTDLLVTEPFLIAEVILHWKTCPGDLFFWKNIFVLQLCYIT